MPPQDDDKLNRIERLKSKLFNKNFNPKIEHREDFPHFKDKEVLDTWVEKEDTFQSLREKFLLKTSMFKKFFIFSVVFFILATGYSSYIFFVKSNTVSNDNIDISILSNAFTNGGEEYPLLLEIVNKNNSPLLLVDLVVEHPKSSESTLSNESERIRTTLDTIPAGATKNENVSLILFGEQGSIRPIKISLEYRVEGSNAIFVKEKTFEVAINSTPINISIEAPSDTTSGKEFSLDIKTTLNATRSASNMMIKVDYPLGFQFIRSNPDPTFDNNGWYLGDMPPGGERNISVTGKMIDAYEGETKYFRVWSGSQDLDDKTEIETVFNNAEHMISIARSLIDVRLSLNGSTDREFAVDTKTGIGGQIIWANNSDAKITNFVIEAKLSGNTLDRRTISPTQGFYNSAQDTLVWDKNYQSKFNEISPGESGAVSFKFSSLPLYSSSGGLLSSPSINIDVSISGRKTDANGVVSDLSTRESKTVKIISDVGFSTKALYYSGAFTNTGPIPPKVEQKTTYTIVWSLSNTANNISKTKVVARLPEWVSFTNKISPAGEDITFNSITREVTWNAGSLQRGTSITRAVKEASFQIGLFPSLGQVGTAPILVNSASLTGHDDFANVDVRATKLPLNSRLFNDTGMPALGGQVIE